jgi:pimeloyl-ACP methyl ester carboxylesterase
MPETADRSKVNKTRAAQPGPTRQGGKPPGQQQGLPLWTALGVALAAMGCAPPGPRTPLSATQGMRASVAAGDSLDTRISFLRAGQPDGPRVVLVHGTPGSATGWADYLVAPPAGAEVVALDRPGFGSSSPDGAVPSLAAQAAAVLALVPTDGRAVVLVGHSLGAPIVAWAAARLAIEQPERIVSIVMLAGSLDPAQERIHAMQHVGTWAPVWWALPRVIRNANAELMALKPELEALGTMLPAVKAKVVIVHGTRDDLVPVANVAYMQARFSGARCISAVLLEGQNHFLPWNSEDAVREALRVALEPTC